MSITLPSKGRYATFEGFLEAYRSKAFPNTWVVYYYPASKGFVRVTIVNQGYLSGLSTPAVLFGGTISHDDLGRAMDAQNEDHKNKEQEDDEPNS